MVRHSGLQRDVLSLYKQCMKAVQQKPADTRGHFRDFARDEFRKNLSINKKDFATIEFLLRSGRRKLETYADEEIRDIHR